jgi:type IV secretory pathway VirB2 component (pilin)
MNITIPSFLTKLLSIISLALFLQALSIEFSFAVDANDQLSCTLKRIVDSLTGPMGKAIATIAIIALGIGLFMGKLSWGLAVATALGIAMIFGASSIVDWLSGSGFDGSINCDSSGGGSNPS